MIIAPHHLAALRTTDSREAQLLHAESWHPKTRTFPCSLYNKLSMGVGHLALQVLLDLCNGSSQSSFILFSQSANLGKKNVVLSYTCDKSVQKHVNP